MLDIPEFSVTLSFSSTAITRLVRTSNSAHSFSAHLNLYTIPRLVRVLSRLVRIPRRILASVLIISRSFLLTLEENANCQVNFITNKNKNKFSKKKKFKEKSFLKSILVPTHLVFQLVRIFM